MKADTPELLFSTRGDFRTWLTENAETSSGVWLVFGKKNAVTTMSANDALEEALCFGWIDGQVRSIDETRYNKYFAKRRTKSIWSEKNKRTVEVLRERGIMTDMGERAVEAAKKNGMWDSSQGYAVTDEQKEAFSAKLAGISPAYENFCNMSQAAQRTYMIRYFSLKTEEARQRNFEKIVDRLNKNLKPM
ncbi:MAG: YdeI/OmpD-associated family protein [Candidatus Methanoplasma sp.]|jgi:uncharacterized protein YdeI (YjbR/CyaY-like superfamily)|nr:YdeI/OmpD-associated family protein [Candidatus Methanoplasma sp.]